MSKHMKRANYLTKWLIGAYNGLIVTYLLNVIIAYTSVNVKQRLYVLPAKFPAFCKQSPTFEIVCIGQFIAAFLSTNSHATIEGLLTTLVLHAGTKVHLFQREIDKLSSIQLTSRSQTVSSEAMRILIKKHLNFIEFVEKIKDIYIYVSFARVCTFTLLHVIVEYMFKALKSGDKSIKIFLYGLFTIRAILNTMIHCISGEYLMNQSKRLFDELYNSLWYEFLVKDLKAMNFMVMKARKPMCLTTAKFNQLSLAYLTSVIRTTFSFLSLARAAR